MRRVLTKIIIVGFFLPGITFANEVVNPNQAAGQTEIAENSYGLSIQEQLGALSKQLTHFQQQNYIEKIQDVQKEVQALRGMIDVQSHELNTLKQQLANKKPSLDTSQQEIIPNSYNPETKEQKSLVDEETNRYKSAFTYLKNKDYDNAITNFNKFVVDFPTGNYTPNCHYWLGEIYILQGKNELAEANLQKVVTNFPSHNKVPDAILKLAVVNVSMKKLDVARNYVKILEKEYSNTTAARMAKLQLGSI